MSASEAVGAAPAAPPAMTRSQQRWSRWSDRLNPILVREVQQAIKGRLFQLMVMLTLGIMVLIAALLTSREAATAREGRQLFEAGVAVLVPLALFVVPMQAYHAMRLEMRGGIVEQLLLSRLVPRSIVGGKLQAALVQFVLYVAVVSPLLATAYLMRGVDLATVGMTLLFGAVCCATSTMLTVASAAQSVLPALQAVASLGTAFGLGILTFIGIGFVVSGGYLEVLGEVLRDGDLASVAVGVVLVTGLAMTFASLAAQVFLKHAFENKSTAFRWLLFCLPVLVLTWFHFSFGAAPNGRWLFMVLASMLVITGIGFGWFAVTEQAVMSPRVRTHVPRSPLLALLAAPFLPGRDRGLLCVTMYFGFLGVLLAMVWPPSLGGFLLMGDPRLTWWLALSVAYGVGYLSLGRWLRRLLPETPGGSQVGRVLLPLVLALMCLLPIIIDAMVTGGRVRWTIAHVGNPFWSSAELSRSDHDGARSLVLAGLAAVFALQIPAMVRGVVEVVRAAAERRQREAAGS